MPRTRDRHSAKMAGRGLNSKELKMFSFPFPFVCMANLLDETKRAIERSGHKESDIQFIRLEESGQELTWDKFCVFANVKYDPAYGAESVANDLIIVFSDGTKMWRGSSYGWSWWQWSRPLGSD